MEKTIYSFRRVEKKYPITVSQQKALLDRFGIRRKK